MKMNICICVEDVFGHICAAIIIIYNIYIYILNVFINLCNHYYFYLYIYLLHYLIWFIKATLKLSSKHFNMPLSFSLAFYA